MVGTLVRLQLRLFWRSARRNVGVLIAMIFGALYLAGFVAAAVVGLVALRSASAPIAGAVTTLGFALLTLAWPLITLLVAGTDQTLDPGRFALYPVRARQLMPGLLAAGLCGVGAVATSILALAQVITWSTSIVATVFAVLAVVFGVPTCILLARTSASFFSSAFTQRKWRDKAAIMLGLMALSIGIGIQLVQRFITDNFGELKQNLALVGLVAGWTPLGWLWSMPGEAARGLWWLALIKLLLGLAALWLLWRVWERQLDRALISPLTASGDGAKVESNSWVDRIFPATPSGAVAARSLRYWRRDPRHLIVVVSVVALPFLMAAPMLINGKSGGDGSGMGSGALYFPVVGMVMMAALTVAGEICYDGSAIWTHITSGLRGRDDRWGRLLAIVIILAPIGLVTVIVFLAVSGQWSYTPAVVGATFGALGAGLGVGSFAGALWQYPTPPPGQNAFAKSSGGGITSLISTVVCMLGSGLLSLPFLVLLGFAERGVWVGWTTLAAAVVLAPFYTWAGVVLGGRALDRSWPEVLKRVTFERS